jgi:acetate kinase
MKNILVVNAGSSSVKFQVIAVDHGGDYCGKRTSRNNEQVIGLLPQAL